MVENGIVGESRSGTAREILDALDEWGPLKHGDDPPDGLGDAAA